MFINGDDFYSLIDFDEGMKLLRKYDGNEYIVSVRDETEEDIMENISIEFGDVLLENEDIDAYPVATRYRNREDIYNGPLAFIVFAERKRIEGMIEKTYDKARLQIQTPEEYRPPKGAYLLSYSRTCPWRHIYI